jgi:hypothetical protein
LEEWFINKKTNPLESIPLSVFYFVTFWESFRNNTFNIPPANKKIEKKSEWHTFVSHFDGIKFILGFLVSLGIKPGNLCKYSWGPKKLWIQQGQIDEYWAAKFLTKTHTIAHDVNAHDYSNKAYII